MRKSTVALLTVAAMACATQVFAQSFFLSPGNVRYDTKPERQCSVELEQARVQVEMGIPLARCGFSS